MVFLRARGVLTCEDLVAERPRILGHPLYSPTFLHLVDLRAVEGIDVSTDEVRELARTDPFASIRRAIVAPKEHTFGLARMYELSHAHSDLVRVFRRLAEARSWLEASRDEESRTQS